MLALSWARMKSHYRHSFHKEGGVFFGWVWGGGGPAIEAETEMRWPRRRTREMDRVRQLLEGFSLAKVAVH